MRRIAGVIFLLWGVGTIMTGGVNLAMGNIPAEGFFASLLGGVILLAIAWWVDRPKTKKELGEPDK